jgi:hypothetical protein
MRIESSKCMFLIIVIQSVWKLQKIYAKLRKIYAKSTQNLRKIYAKSTQNLRKIYAKSTQNQRKINAKSTQNLCKIYAKSTRNLRKIYAITCQINLIVKDERLVNLKRVCILHTNVHIGKWLWKNGLVKYFLCAPFKFSQKSWLSRIQNCRPAVTEWGRVNTVLALVSVFLNLSRSSKAFY